MKLNKEARKQLLNIFNDMQKTEMFLLKNSTVIATISSITHAKENTWVNAETKETAGTFNKNIGNDLCYLNNAINSLNNFLNKHQ